MRLFPKKQGLKVLLFFTFTIICVSLYSFEWGASKLISEKNEKDLPTKAYTLDIQQIQGDWLLGNPSIFDSILHFKRFMAKDSSLTYGDKFTIKGSKIIYSIYNPGVECANGLLSIDSCAIQISEDHLELFFKGGYIAEHGFIYKAQYQLIKKHPLGFILAKKKTMIHEVSAFYDD